MDSSAKLLFSFSFIVLHLAAFAIAQSDSLYRRCSPVGNYTANSTYQKNLNSLLSSIASDTEIDYGFYNLSAGQTENQVYAIALCRGDVGLEDCRSCVKNSTRMILQVCPNQKEAIDMYDYCMLRFSNKSIFGVVEESPKYYMWSPNNVSSSELNQFNQVLQALLITLRSEAASGDSTRKFAIGNGRSGFYTIYALMQCTPDLSQRECDDCLIGATAEIPIYSSGKQGGRVINPAATSGLRLTVFTKKLLVQLRQHHKLRYLLLHPKKVMKLNNFNAIYDLNGFLPLNMVKPTPDFAGKKSNKAWTTVIIIAPTVSIVIFVICICLFLKLRKPREKVETADEIEKVESLQFDFGTIRVATKNFCEENKLGQGGFGAVYKGTLSNGQDVAVKRLSNNSGQGDLEFKNEVLLVAKLQHRNLVRLLGFCLEGKERLLIYEFVPNASLDHFIFDPIKRAHLNWERRYKIIGGMEKLERRDMYEYYRSRFEGSVQQVK
ncbi:hypothetical protein GH714_020473 [Hevea brasiliensis]|uniref:Uncharacterized protein n=1 Tax=Hevea brasiliensis TaxID=3981 RepID=A0A6A6M3Z6_HEVBR|nr:hypothetical protein GH714_020473 [Hevea brasiliensis]